jgi:S-adenosylmethionine-diacylglycerol 3-amino-3-carboxypropyl transferase
MGGPRAIEARLKMDSIRYANCWEDADVLCLALEPQPGRRILSVGSAGDNSLALLAEGAEVVVADLSLAQLAAIEIRKVAFARLEYEELLPFLGVSAASDRLRTYAGLRSELSESSRDQWDANPGLVAAGVIHAGKLERYFRLFRRRILPWIHSARQSEVLLLEKDPQQRRDYYDRTWNTWYWRTLFRLFFSRFVMARLGREREFFRYAEGTVAERVFQRTEYALRELGTHDNPYLEYILRGTFQSALPRYLQPNRFAAIRSGLERLTLMPGPIEAVGRAHRGAGFEGFNLSNIFEYLAPNDAAAVYCRLFDLAKPGARLAYWNTFVPRSAPEQLGTRVRHLAEFSEQLFRRDRAFFYQRFLVDQVESTSTVPA